MYLYKGEVGIPPLGMIDDLLDISECGVDSVIDNAYINAQFEMNKLELNKKKCHHLHIGTVNPNCPKLIAYDEIMKKVSEDKYLGDTITNSIQGNKKGLFPSNRDCKNYITEERGKFSFFANNSV